MIQLKDFMMFKVTCRSRLHVGDEEGEGSQEVDDECADLVDERHVLRELLHHRTRRIFSPRRRRPRGS